LHGVLQFNLNLEEFHVKINDDYVNFSAQRPIFAGNRSLVPMREVFELLGFTVGWDGDTELISLINADYNVHFSIGSNFFATNSTNYTLESPAIIINYATLMPIQAVLESVGYNTYWDTNSDGTRVLVIRK
jgi:hypothetical protein